MLARLSPGGSDVAVIAGGDARLLVHRGTAPPRQYVERDGKYTCLAWNGTSEMICVGKKTGDMAVWDVTRGVKIGSADRPACWSEYSSSSPSSPCALAWSHDGQQVLAACGEEFVARWSVSSSSMTVEEPIKADKRGVTALATRPVGGGTLACGSTRLRLVKIRDQDELFADKKKDRTTLKGSTHASSAIAIAWTADGRFVASIARRERTVVVVDVAGELPAFSLSFDSATLSSLSVTSVGKRTVKVHAAATCEDGAARVAKAVAVDGADWKTESSLAAIRNKNGRAADVRFFDGKLLVALADNAGVPEIENVDYQDERGPPPLKKSKTSDDHGGAGNEVEEDEGKVTVVGAMESLPALPGFELKEAEQEEDEALEERLARLEEETDRIAEAEKAKPAVVPMPGDARSLAAALAQATRARDDAMMEEVLQHRDEEVMDATVDRLDAAVALPLVSAIVTRMERRPTRALHLARWTAKILLRHAATLTKTPEFNKELNRLDVMLQKRAAALPHFIALQGRLEFELNRDRLTTQNTPATYEPRREVLFASNVNGDEDHAEDQGTTLIKRRQSPNNNNNNHREEDEEEEEDGF